MARRTTPQKRTDDLAFPIRVKIAVPSNGFGKLLTQSMDWLNINVGVANFAWHGSQTIAADASALYFREVEDARAFLRNHPELELADGTQSVAYSRPPIDAQEVDLFGVCNLYSMTKGQDAIRALFDNIGDKTGNLPPLPDIYPDQQAPVVANTEEGHVLTMMRWGMPSPSFALKNRNYDRGVTNVRNTQSPHWRRWLGPENRCVVPFTAFSEPGSDRKPVWFKLRDDQMGFFAGIWTPWTSVRKVKDGETSDNLFGFLTTEPNSVVGAIHPKAMPVILTSQEEIERWMSAPAAEALKLQRPLQDDALGIV